MRTATKRAVIASLMAGFLATANAEEGDEEELDPQFAPEDCVSIPRIRDTDIIDDRTILFEMKGGQIYRNTLPRKCPGLRRSDAFMYKTRLSQLCAIDTISVLNRLGGGFTRGPSCGLGKFYPISEDEAIRLKQGEPPPEEPEPVEDEEQTEE